MFTKPKEEPAHNSVVKALFRFMPYWPLFTTFLLISAAGCFLFSVFSTSLYESSATILIQDKNKGAGNSKQVEELDVLQSKKIVDNERDVIISKPLVLEVINKLHLYAPVYRINRIKDQLLYEQAPVVIECRKPETIFSQSKIPFTWLSDGIVLENRKFARDTWYSTSYGELKFITNPNYRPVQGETNFLFSLEKPKSLARSFQERLMAKPTTKLSSIIEVSFRDEDPQRAEDFILALLNAYIDAGMKDRYTLAGNTAAFVDQRIKVVEKELQQIEQGKQEYAAKNGAFDLSTQGRLFLENVSANDQKMGEINMGLAVLSELENYMAPGHEANGMVPSTLGISDPMLSQMAEKLYNAELQYESLKKTAGDNNPIVLPLKAQVEKIKPDLRQLIINQRRNLEASRNNILSTNNSFGAMLSNLPKTERELVDLDRQQNIKSSVYSYLLQKKEETALSQQSILPESRTISTDTSDSPVSPNMKLLYLAAAIVAVIFGMGFISARDMVSKKVMFRDQIESATAFPVVGEISIGSSPDPIVITDNTKTFIAEQFRRLRMTLSYLDGSPDPKKILITSAISGEGKSFISSNLALALALSGKKVALLDFDLNNPSLNNKLNISRNKGITDFLMDECSLEEIVHPTDLDPNLYLVLTGSLPHNPTELLMNGRSEILLNELEKSFDYIVIDTAPVIPVTDAYILSKFCDATLYVIRHKYTPKIFLERMDEENRMHRLKNVGIIFNSVSSRGIGNSNYGYGYGYGYTYENDRKDRRKPLLR